MKIKRSILIAWLIIYAERSFCQQKDTLITGSFTGLTIEEFAKAVETKTSYRFYFDSAQFSSFTVNVIADNEPLKQLMNKVFFNTNYFAAIHESNVFLTSGEEIITDFNERPGVLNAKK